MPDSPSRGEFDVVVLAASRGPDDPMAHALGVPHKCLIEVGGTPMLARVIGALAACPQVREILVSVEERSIIDAALRDGPADGIAGRVSFVRSLAQASASVVAAANRLGFERPILVTTADHALLTPEMITFFCERALATGADVCVALEHADILLGAYPNARRTFIRFSDGGYSGCNLFALTTPQAMRAVEHWQRVEKQRKTPWRLFRVFGLRPLLQYLLGRLSLDDAMMQASARLGIAVAAVRMPFTDAAIDVDKPEDLEAVQEILAKRSA